MLCWPHGPRRIRTAKICSAKRPRSSSESSWSPARLHRAGEPIVVGFRRDGALSIFFGDDPVYQFNAAGELRRAYCDGLLFKAVRGRLVSLRRVRGQHDEVQLVRHDLTRREQAAFLSNDGRALPRSWRNLLADERLST